MINKYMMIKTINTNNKKLPKILAITVAVMILLLLAFSLIAMPSDLVHEHDSRGSNGECSVCIQLQTIVNFIKQGSVYFTLAVLACYLALCIIWHRNSIPNLIYGFNPISLKTRMNN